MKNLVWKPTGLRL